jgi:hypothetical protein
MILLAPLHKCVLEMLDILTNTSMQFFKDRVADSARLSMYVAHVALERHNELLGTRATLQIIQARAC